MEAITVSADGPIVLSGPWTINNGSNISSLIANLVTPKSDDIVLQAEDIDKLDSAGALLLSNLISKLKNQHKNVALENLNEANSSLLALVEQHLDEISKPEVKPKKEGLLYLIGKQADIKRKQALQYLSFVGEVSHIFSKTVFAPARWRWAAIFQTIDDAGYSALPIIALLSFLIGVVLAYQLGLQLETYGANIFLINFTGLAVLREFGPLITAIIVAGRTSSAFTAQIGLMKVNEEIDALKVMGIMPLNRIILPKIIGVVITLPLITVWADAFGVIGSMVMSEIKFGISMPDFLERFDDVTQLSSLWTGLVKAPVFGILIASVGCFQGLKVSYSADSIGHQTTRSVVQAIFLVIVADAFFSVLFSWAGI